MTAREGRPTTGSAGVTLLDDLLPMSEAQEDFRHLVRTFAEREVAPVVADADRNEKFPRSLLDKMAEVGLFGGCVPTELGGLGLDYVTYAIIIEEMAKVDHIAAVYMSMASGLVGAGILRYGTPEQHDTWLRPLAEGRIFGAGGVTEPRSGSDVAGMTTAYRREGDEFVIKGAKAWISNLDHADFVLTFATRDRSLGRSGISAFIVPLDAPGVATQPYKNKLGFRSICTGDLFLDEVRLSSAHLLGKEGEGFAVAMSAVESGRLSVAARAVGQAHSALGDAMSYASQRVVFDTPVSEFQMTKSKVTDMAEGVLTARLLTRTAAARLDTGDRSRVALSMAKQYASDVLQRVATEAVQIHGAAGTSSETRVGRIYRDAKVFQLVEGANEIHREMIADYLLGHRS
ncbi:MULTISPECIES: acyl-CoA dehydrogenase family protein [Streptomyces]|uniref:Acyl-CoA dehydrogenase n=1 Tax=Streptomyces rhizosphaericus TaxID=114699 RepID=A0A6G4A9A6_9ACTN|nr:MULTISPECIES: acyl-CoA dehydrogenase family protein [Streptomyces]NEW69281.1 acyl-CoA dehydrogenase [Streptomyces rhizosphaericus]